VIERHGLAPEHPMCVEFARSMAPLMATPAGLLARMLKADEAKPSRVLRWAAGHGLYEIAIARQNPAAEVWVPGRPLHRHSREDEWFHILDGEITAEIDGQRTVLQSGGSAFAARGTTHTFQNFSDSVAKMLVMVTPGVFQQFFEELSSLNNGLPSPDLARTERLMQSYGIELLGPPLS
jgi:mannose-6-phosphate isomerase-like protein (cupin superfamily)